MTQLTDIYDEIKGMHLCMQRIEACFHRLERHLGVIENMLAPPAPPPEPEHFVRRPQFPDWPTFGPFGRNHR